MEPRRIPKSRLSEIVGASKVARDVTEVARLLALATEHAANTEKLSEVGAVVASTLDREKILQKVTGIPTEPTGARFRAFFYYVTDPEPGNAYMLYTLSGAPTGGVYDIPASTGRSAATVARTRPP